MKKLLLLATGGTIASKKMENGLSPQLSSEEILSYLPEEARFANIETRQILNIDSTNIQPEDWTFIAEVIQKAYEDYDGFIITHGTDTMAYTAAALSYLIQNPGKPIVLTGSQKPISDDITDARKNLADSLRFACEGQAAGVYIVFDGKAILGTRARKVRSKSYSAFESINYPAAAFIDGRRVIHYTAGASPKEEPAFSLHLNPRVFLLKLIPGMEPDILDYISDQYDAVIIESYGVGGIPFYGKRNFLEKLKSLTQKGKIAVIATQVMLEGSDAEIYEVGNQALQQYNVLQAYDMTVEAAVVKLMWIMAETRDYETVREKFYTCIHNDILTE
ncbi:MAG: asparaginase [Oscillospiraceae bacterium]|nr:asparaginase [Oscillospiraceae bacterium]